MTSQITFIGGGNMAASLIGGLISNGQPADSIRVAEPDAERLNTLQAQYGVQVSTDNPAAVEAADLLVLAVKPQILQTVCRDLADSVQQRRPLIISVAAGIRSADIERWLGGELAIVRCMPNTPALLQQGATGLFANARVSGPQRTQAETILQAAGITLWVDDETLIDAVTAVSGSGPAYFFLLMEQIQRAGEKLGLDTETARRLTLQTALGAARMANESDDEIATLRSKVTSKGGTTEAAINSFIEQGIEAMVNQALTAARDRATELADLLGKDQ
ncbi:MAG: pyrroline-5-carboxylate reductase [Chromatiales bacterium]|jgi:pyrroline-5-carboxylate reductase